MFYKHSPSIPILPSPSLSPDAIRALVSATVSSLAPGEKFWRNSLKGRHKNKKKHRSSKFRLYLCWCLFFTSKPFSVVPVLLTHAKRKGCSIHTVTSAWGPSWGTVTTNCRCNTHAQTNTHTPSVPPCAPAQVFQPHTPTHTCTPSLLELLLFDVSTLVLVQDCKHFSPVCFR